MPEHHVLHLDRAERRSSVDGGDDVPVAATAGRRSGPRRRTPGPAPPAPRSNSRDHVVGCRARRSSRRRSRRAGRRARPAPPAERNHGSSMTSGCPTRRQHPLGDRLRAGRHGHPAAVARSGRCCAARCWPSGCRAGAGSRRAGRRRSAAGRGSSAAARAATGRSPARGRRGRGAAAPSVTAYAPASAAIPSARPNGGSVGGPSGSPVMCAKPLIASASVPKRGAASTGRSGRTR